MHCERGLGQVGSVEGLAGCECGTRYVGGTLGDAEGWTKGGEVLATASNDARDYELEVKPN